MAITQDPLIGWQAVEASGDLVILRGVLDNLGDEELVAALEAGRMGRRDKYPVRAVWNALVAAVILGHRTVAEFIRELRRNGELRQVLGFDPLLGDAAVPPDYVFSRMFRRLVSHRDVVRGMFESLVERVAGLLPDLGERLVADGKAIVSVRRSDVEAGVGVKCTTDGAETVVFTWHGYKIHCLADATHELPIAFHVTAPTESESPHLLPLVREAFERHPAIAERARSLAADKGYDDGADKKALADELDVMPIIPARELGTEKFRPLDEKTSDTIYITSTGEVCCRHDPFNPEREKQFCAMQFCGYEKDRQTLKFRCPAAAFGLKCNNQAACRSAARDRGHGRTLRVPIDKDPRILTPVYQKSLRFEKLYNMRTGIERMFFRLDHMFGMETPLRSVGLEKATVRVTLAFAAMLATAIGWLEQHRVDKIRSRLRHSAA